MGPKPKPVTRNRKRKKERRVFLKTPTITYTTDDNFLYAETEGGPIRLDLFAGHYYKLKPYNGVPILEIDGLRMHLIRDFKTPLEYSEKVVKALKIPDGAKAEVLDTCMGLGYTAIEAAKQGGVKLVVTCEVSEAVVTLAQWNPFSDRLFKEDGGILVMKGSVVDLIKDLQDGMFSFVIHDPPRLSHAPDLYSLDFYKQLYRVCKKGARLFHYVGSVGKGKGRNIEKEVSKRLFEAGFRKITYSALLQGLVFEK
ncbi:MAG: SAM-dependent methyltransferase [Candidatus Micrarchaeota archaeon]